MIRILHGEDTSSSYQRLSQILASLKNCEKVSLTAKNSLEDFYLAVFSEDLFSQEKAVVCEEFISQKKIKTPLLKKITPEKNVIFWEKKQIPPALLSGFKNLAQIENFKPKGEIFYFLDSLKPGSKQPLVLLSSLPAAEKASLLWNLSSRIFQMTCAKLNFGPETASKITSRPIQDWQWAKIKTQAKEFTLEILLSFYGGVLQADNLIKSGKTDLTERNLISLLLLKYLRS